MRTFTNYDDMIGVTHNLDTINKLKLVYPNPEDIELFPGGISELSVRNGLVGEVFANIMGLQFKKIKFGDRFWHETNDPIVRFTNGEYTRANEVLMRLRLRPLLLFFNHVCAVLIDVQIATFCQWIPHYKSCLLKAESNTQPKKF